jgi:phthalate 4,5-cis-dihydrodiol dehydrogenase
LVGVGIIGAGWWAGEHAKAITAMPEARLIGFSSRTPARVAAFQRAYGVAGYDDYRRLLDRPDVDAVAIAVPHDVHAAIAIEALRAGKHVLLEKPMARNREECTAIAAAAANSGKSFMLGLTHHFIPEVAMAKALIDRGDLGEVVAGFCAAAHPWEWQRRPQFYLDRALGGGVWLTLGVHYVDRLLWLVDSEVIAVKAVMGRRFHRPEEHSADDAVSALFQFANGAAGTIILAGQRAGPSWNELQLVGTRGSLRLDERGLVAGQGDAWQPVDVSNADPTQLEWLAFIGSIKAETPPPITLAYALRVMDVVFAAEDSAAAGREWLV